MLGYREAAQVSQHPQAVLVHRVDVEEVVLHPPDDVGERRDIGGQHAVAVHALGSASDARRVAHDLHEQAAGAQVRAKRVVDEVAVLADQADGARPHTLELRMRLQDVENLQQGNGVAAKDVVPRNLQRSRCGLGSAC